ncbi:MAG: hypothetical protein H6851_18620 [Geminicoccaceae bacterium]|nr:hypothetical protein [Geminicoccaceae bacterium]
MTFIEDRALMPACSSPASKALPTPESLLAALPRLSAEELIPEVNSLVIDTAGNLVPRARRQNYIITFSYMGRRVTARFSGNRDESITMEVGCRLIRLPYSAEGLARRKALVERIHRMRGFKLGQLSVTHHQWLYYRDRIRLEPARITASWIVAQLITMAFIVKPVIGAFAEFENVA